MSSKKLVSALLAALSSVSLSGGSLSFAATKKLKQDNNTMEKPVKIKRSKSLKLGKREKINLVKGSNEIKNIEKDLNEDAKKGVSYKVVSYAGGVVVVTVAIAGLGVVGYKKMKIKDRNKKVLEELKDDGIIKFIKVEDEDFGPEVEKVENGGELVGGKMNENNVKKEKVKDDEGADLSCPESLEEFEKAIIDEFGKFESWVETALSFDYLNADNRKLIVGYGKEVNGSYFCASIGGKNILVCSGDWKDVDNAIAFGWDMIPGHIIRDLFVKYGEEGEYSCPKDVDELKKRISDKWNNVKGFVDAALEEGMSDIKGRKLFAKTCDVDGDKDYVFIPDGRGISFLYDDWKFNKGRFLGWDMISSDMVPNLLLG